MNNNTKAVAVVAEICLYGNRETGAGWLAQPKGGRIIGSGDLVAGLSFTEAVWAAAAALAETGIGAGGLRIYAPGGERVATVPSIHHVPCFGDLKWEPAAPAMVIRIEPGKGADGASALVIR